MSTKTLISSIPSLPDSIPQEMIANDPVYIKLFYNSQQLPANSWYTPINPAITELPSSSGLITINQGTIVFNKKCSAFIKSRIIISGLSQSTPHATIARFVHKNPDGSTKWDIAGAYFWDKYATRFGESVNANMEVNGSIIPYFFQSSTIPRNLSVGFIEIWAWNVEG